ncbi:hypothetical protein Y1Q_0002748 [Alligator mississippiensis]|uniref:Uncharacterized protein n=1 Tax=Alligator mississippiensis TaxID=8496 RepID=A0A151NZ08_ALLMI|nr:hypothetical protein Y1Q_0002748 [Alligator mississippiensis]
MPDSVKEIHSQKKLQSRDSSPAAVGESKQEPGVGKTNIKQPESFPGERKQNLNPFPTSLILPYGTQSPPPRAVFSPFLAQTRTCFKAVNASEWLEVEIPFLPSPAYLPLQAVGRQTAF